MGQGRQRALGVALGILMGLSPEAVSEPAGQYSTGVKARVVLKTTTTGSGEKIAYLKTGSPEVTAMTVDIPPGTETGWHVHRVPVYAWVVSGALTVELEGGSRNAYKEGDAIVEAVGVGHNGKNLGTVPVRLLVFYTGLEGEPNVERRPEPPPGRVPPAPPGR